MDFLISVADKYGLFVALVVYILWANQKRETKLMDINQKRENKYIEREERYIGIVQTLSEEVKERLAKIETTLKRR